MTEPSSRTGRRGGEGLPAAAFVVAIVGSLGFAIAFVQDFGTQVLGVTAALMLGGIGVGLVSWAKRFMTPAHPDVEPRGRIESTEEEIAAFQADFNIGEFEVERRTLLTKLLVGAVSAMGLAAVIPFKSLGPSPGSSFTDTPWEPGKRVIDVDGLPVRAIDLQPDSLLTVFPDGAAGNELAQTVLIGMHPGRNVPAPGREDWTPQNLIAYSKVCTHAGCPVGLFEASTGRLLCPCHQSTFDIYRACEPVFGPAATPLPQLPLEVDGDGFVRAAGDFSSPPGPAFWNQRKP